MKLEIVLYRTKQNQRDKKFYIKIGKWILFELNITYET